MKPVHPSRREFLQRSSAALAAGSTLCFLGKSAFSETQSAKARTEGPRQGVACSRKEAAEAARDVLRQGGNAIDAAVAALLVQCVIEPSNVGLGGYGGSLIIYRPNTGRVHAIDFTSRAPRKFDPATFNEVSRRHGYLAVGTPGVIAGIDLALREYGTLPFNTLSQPALALAENGIPVTPRLRAAFDKLLKSFDPVSQQAYFPSGVPEKGSTWVQSDLARLIRRLGDDGLASFYQGELAATIARQVQANGGVLAEDDFHDFKATVVEPLHITYRGYDLYTPPLPSGGLTSLSILKTLEQFDLQKLPPWGTRYIELFAGASNLTWAERYQHFGDPEFVDVPVEDLLSEKRAIARAEKLRSGTPTAPVPPGESSHTVNITVVDKEQNLVSWTATHGDDFGSHVAIEGLGLMLGHGMSRFDLQPESPNFPAAGKRPQHNMCPLVVLHEGKPYAALGLPGGPKIVTVTAQLAVNLIDFHATPQQIVSAPRIHTEGQEPIQITSDTPAAVVDELKQKGHRVDVQPSLGGPANAVIVDRNTGEVQAAGTGTPTSALAF